MMEIVVVAWPRQFLLGFPQLLQFHRQLALANIVVREHLSHEPEYHINVKREKQIPFFR